MAKPKKTVEMYDVCPVCKSTRHSDAFDVKTGSYIDENQHGDLVSFPSTTEFVFCLDCGVVRAYNISIFLTSCDEKYIF